MKQDCREASIYRIPNSRLFPGRNFINNSNIPSDQDQVRNKKNRWTKKNYATRSPCLYGLNVIVMKGYDLEGYHLHFPREKFKLWYLNPIFFRAINFRSLTKFIFSRTIYFRADTISWCFIESRLFAY